MDGLQGLIDQAGWSDLWFAFALFNHVDTGDDLRQTGETFLGLMKDTGADINLEWLDVEWLVLEYHKRL